MNNSEVSVSKMVFMSDTATMGIYYIAIEYQIKTYDGEGHFLKHCM
jgi:hypothetical protein